VHAYTDLSSPRGSQDGQQEDQVSPGCAPAVCPVPLNTRVSPGCAPAVCPVPLNTRVFCDPGTSLQGRQSRLDEAFALLTLSLYLGWVHILFMLCVASIFSSTARWICIGEHLTPFRLRVPAHVSCPHLCNMPNHPDTQPDDTLTHALTMQACSARCCCRPAHASRPPSSATQSLPAGDGTSGV
jgi:hypothetical protein